MPKHKEHLDRKKTRAINYISFFLGFSQAVLIYVMSSYFKQASGTENVGGFYFIAYSALLLILLNLHKLTRRMGKTSVFLVILALKIISLVFLVNSAPSSWGIFLLMLYVIFSGLEWVSLDTILESFSCDKESGRIRGKHLTVLNAGFLLGPFVSTRLLGLVDFSGVFVFLLLFNVLVFFYALFKLRDTNGKPQVDISVSNLLRKISKRKNVMAIYYVSFVLEFFYALMIIYMPIYLRDIGLSWSQIGIVFSVMLLPFVFLQYPMGFSADKKMGEKKLLICGLLIMAVSTTVVYFVHAPVVFVWSLTLLGTRIGAAMVEILRDSYFYKRIDGDDVDLIGFFRTAMPVGYILAASLSFVLLLFLPLSAIFLLSALIIFSALIPAYRLAENRLAKKS
ncbi:MAG: MFS transporter [Candidatus Moranbacteria bacterium]|nr:MFS transporter [Candidatus Moranbacteria bacterium]